MYSIVQSYVRDRKSWVEKNLNDVKMVDILTAYEEVHITINDNGIAKNWRPVTSEWYQVMYASPYTLAEWISHCNNNSIRLTLTSRPFSFDILETVTSYEAQSIGFKVERGNAYLHPDSEANMVGEDLRLSRDGTDYSKFVDNVLISVNGIIHPVVSNDNGLYAKYGHKSISHDRLYDINMINFEAIGGFKLQRIPFANRYLQNKLPAKIYNNCCFNLGFDVTDKVIGVILDGYLHLLDDVVSVVGKTQIRIDWRRVPLRKRTMVAKGNPPGKSELRSVITVNEDLVKSDEWLLDILESPFSFLMIFNRKDITKTQRELFSKELPGVYFYPTDINGPIFTGVGETYSYHKTRDHTTFDNVKEEHTVINLPLKGSYPCAIETGIGSRHQQLGMGTYVGANGFEMPVVKNILYHVLPENF